MSLYPLCLYPLCPYSRRCRCGHVFGRCCIDEHLKGEQTCPPRAAPKRLQPHVLQAATHVMHVATLCIETATPRRCPLCRVRCQPADVWLLFVSNEVQPDTTRHQARGAELELLCTHALTHPVHSLLCSLIH